MAMRAGLHSAYRSSSRSASLGEALPRLVEFMAAGNRMPKPIYHGFAEARKFSSSILEDPVAGRIQICHRAADEVYLSSAASAVRLHQHSSSRSFSSSRSLSNGKILLPHEKVIVTASSVPLQHSRSFSSSRSLYDPNQKVIVPFPKTGVIRADLGYFRAKGVNARLPVVRQLSFYEEADIYLTPWESPGTHLNEVPSLIPARRNPLLADVDQQEMMHTKAMRKLWKSAMNLFTVNRWRGYCISKGLVEKNLAVSKMHGTFALIRPIAEDISDDPSRFMGFKAVKRLFCSLMEKRYGRNFHSMLTPDVLDWLDTLEDPFGSDGDLPTDHAWMLPDEGRAWLSIRLAQLLSGDLKGYLTEEWAGQAQHLCQKLLSSFHRFSVGIDDLHPFFGAWHNHARKVKENKEVADLIEGAISEKIESGADGDQSMKVESEKVQGSDSGADGDQSMKVESEKVQGGSWVVRMNRHAPLHWFSKDLSKLAGKYYRRDDVIGLLHHKLPMYLPLAQAKFQEEKLLHILDMPQYFGKTVVHPSSSDRKKVRPRSTKTK